MKVKTFYRSGYTYRDWEREVGSEASSWKQTIFLMPSFNVLSLHLRSALCTNGWKHEKYKLTFPFGRQYLVFQSGSNRASPLYPLLSPIDFRAVSHNLKKYQINSNISNGFFCNFHAKIRQIAWNVKRENAWNSYLAIFQFSNTPRSRSSECFWQTRSKLPHLAIRCFLKRNTFG